MPSYETTRFGNLEYDAHDVIELSEGLIGLPQLRRWILLDMDQDLPMRFMQSLDRPDFGVPVMPPVFFAEEYEVKGSATVKRLKDGNPDPDLVTLIITTIHQGGEKVTGNLRAPLVLDASTRRGAQLALDDERLSTRQEIDYFKFGLAVAGESTENEDQATDEVATETSSSEELAETVAS